LKLIAHQAAFEKKRPDDDCDDENKANQ
jgi:hypothetical protein